MKEPTRAVDLVRQLQNQLKETKEEAKSLREKNEDLQKRCDEQEAQAELLQDDRDVRDDKPPSSPASSSAVPSVHVIQPQMFAGSGTPAYQREWGSIASMGSLNSSMDTFSMSGQPYKAAMSTISASS